MGFIVCGGSSKGGPLLLFSFPLPLPLVFFSSFLLLHYLYKSNFLLGPFSCRPNPQTIPLDPVSLSLPIALRFDPLAFYSYVKQVHHLLKKSKQDKKIRKWFHFIEQKREERIEQDTWGLDRNAFYLSKLENW